MRDGKMISMGGNRHYMGGRQACPQFGLFVVIVEMKWN